MKPVSWTRIESAAFFGVAGLFEFKCFFINLIFLRLNIVTRPIASKYCEGQL